MWRVTVIICIAASLAGVAGCKGGVVALIEPKGPFSAAEVAPRPDYSAESSWAALPGRKDRADVTPRGESDRQRTAGVDVFFIHPTTYYDNDHWNQPLMDEKARERTQDAVMRNQASAFNEAARVYAPFYRQATLAAFVTERLADARAAIDLAYSDVLDAFDYYLENYNDGRPIIVASHSQGSVHAMRLLADRFAGESDLRDRLVAAYVIGMTIPTDHFERTIKPIPPCETESDTGCLIGWLTWIEGGDMERMESGNSFIPYGDEYETHAGKTPHCTNPLLWTTGPEVASSSDHVGAVKFGDDDSPEIDRNYVESARCDETGALFVELPDRKYRLLGKNLHLADYPLFHMDIRKNAVTRATAYLESAAR